jgi:hypothetical protein
MPYRNFIFKKVASIQPKLSTHLSQKKKKEKKRRKLRTHKKVKKEEELHKVSRINLRLK